MHKKPDLAEDSYEPEAYWERRLSHFPNVVGTGHRQFSMAYNEAMYKVAMENLRSALSSARIDIAGSRILDIGAGLGNFVEQYILWGANHVTGVDIAESSIRNLQLAFPAHRFVRADVSDPGFSVSEEYDLVCAISVIFHIVDDDKFRQAIENMCRCVRPGGALLISDAFRRLPVTSGRHVRLRSLNSYRSRLVRHGLRVITVHPMYYFFGRTYVPVVGPLILNCPPVIRWLLHAERWMSQHAQQRPGYLQYLIARREP